MSERKIFWLRFGLYVLFSIIIPLSYIAIRFKLFQKANSITIGIWGIVFICLAIGLIWLLFKQLRDGMKFGLAKQIIDGICRITFPLVTATLCIYWMDKNVKSLIELLIVLSIFETIAIPINPLPKWKFENHIEQTASLFSIILEKIKK